MESFRPGLLVNQLQDTAVAPSSSRSAPINQPAAADKNPQDENGPRINHVARQETGADQERQRVSNAQHAIHPSPKTNYEIETDESFDGLRLAPSSFLDSKYIAGAKRKRVMSDPHARLSTSRAYRTLSAASRRRRNKRRSYRGAE